MKNELIARIKAEIDKRYAEYREKMKTDDFTYYEGMADALDLFEQFIDTLESEKPINPADAMKEIEEKIALVKQRGSWDGVDVDKFMDEVRGREPEKPVPNDLDFEQELYNHFGQIKDFTLGMRIGQYFYNLGRDSVPLPEDTVLFNKGVEEGKRLMMEEMSECFAQLKQVQSESINMSAVREQLAYNRGASDERYKMRKKMMNEAVEGTVYGNGDYTWVAGDIPSQFKYGDKVRIIVLPKED